LLFCANASFAGIHKLKTAALIKACFIIMFI
jgi:geranylgeranyl pyrophosphate synthase